MVPLIQLEEATVDLPNTEHIIFFENQFVFVMNMLIQFYMKVYRYYLLILERCGQRAIWQEGPVIT